MHSLDAIQALLVLARNALGDPGLVVRVLCWAVKSERCRCERNRSLGPGSPTSQTSALSTRLKNGLAFLLLLVFVRPEDQNLVSDIHAEPA